MPHSTIGALVAAQEVERARIARELHDGIGQKLAMLEIHLSQLARSLSSQEQRKQARVMSNDIADISRELHGVAYDLHPLRLELLGLEKSIAALCAESSRQSGIAIAFSPDAGLPRPLSASESLCLYRVAQEALHNIVKHSRARRASVRLVVLPGFIGLEITDAGRGFDASARSNGLGLASMRQRVALLNGTIEMQSRQGGGTSISARIPVQQPVHRACA